MERNSLLIVLLVILIFFAGGSVFLALTLPEKCSDVCGPAVEVNYPNTFIIISPSNIHISWNVKEPDIVYDGENWYIPEESKKSINQEYQITNEDHIFPPEAEVPYFIPKVEIKDNKVLFDVIIYNNIGYDITNVTFNIVFDVSIRKNTHGAYGIYSKYDPEQWKETIDIENLPDNSSKKIRIYAPLFEIKEPESIYIEVSLFFPEKVKAGDGTFLEFDRTEYIPSITVPDVYDARSSGRQYNKTNVFAYYINPAEFA